MTMRREYRFMVQEAQALKSKNWKYIIPYIGLNLIACYILAAGAENIWKVPETAVKSALWIAGSGALAVILNGLLSDHAKAVLVFWRLRHPLPGSRAFSRYINADPRIDPGVLRNRWGQLPSEPTDQNRLWYRIYRQHEDRPSVRDAHGSYLLTRDLTALSAIFFVTLGPISLYLTKNSTSARYYLIILVVLYGITSQAARTYGRRLVTNVLALETSF